MTSIGYRLMSCVYWSGSVLVWHVCTFVQSCESGWSSSIFRFGSFAAIWHIWRFARARMGAWWFACSFDMHSRRAEEGWRIAQWLAGVSGWVLVCYGCIIFHLAFVSLLTRNQVLLDIIIIAVILTVQDHTKIETLLILARRIALKQPRSLAPTPEIQPN